MSAIMKISPQGQIRIPKKILHSLEIDSGDYVEIEAKEGHIILKPRKLIDPAQGCIGRRNGKKLKLMLIRKLKKIKFHPVSGRLKKV